MILNKLKSQQGYTLVELIVAIAVFGIVISATYTFLFTNQEAYFSVVSRVTAQTEVRNALDNIITNLRRADQELLRNTTDGHELIMEVTNENGITDEYQYKVEKNNETELFELILYKGGTRLMVAKNLDGQEGFDVENQDNTIKVSVQILVKKFNQISTFDMENYHKIKVDIE